jgi:hypothetical protein
VRLINQLHTYSISPTPDVSSLVQIRPIGKSSSGKQMTSAIALATGSVLELRDIYNNPLISFELQDTSDSIVDIAG